MKRTFQDIWTALLMGLVLPGCVMNAAASLSRGAPPAEETVAVTETRAAKPERASGLSVCLRLPDGTSAQLDMDAYLVSVVLAEMPASFGSEALKAQAVAARTYTLKASVTGGKHADGSVCTDPGCCQGYLDQESYLKKGGTQEGIDRIRRAVDATSGYVLTYGGELIEATYFSCSGGRTEDAVAVWGTDFPYLRSVESPGEEQAAHDSDTLIFTQDQIREALGRDLEGPPQTWFGETLYTEGGGVASMVIGGEAYTGTWLRETLGLPSTAFTVEVRMEQIVFQTRGYGHRVGMSQYGADAMADKGWQYEQILSHYYPGTELVLWESFAVQ